MKKLIVTKNGSYESDLTQEEIDEKTQSEQDYNNYLESIAYKKERIEKYKQKGWNDPFDLIDDILDRGIEAVKADRDLIKTNNPK